MLRRPLFIVAVLLGLDYLVWLWSLSGSRGAIGVVAGPLLVLLAAALVLLAVKELARVLASGPRRRRTRQTGRRRPGAADPMRYRESAAATPAGPEDGIAPDFDGSAPVVTGSPSSAQIAA